VFGSYVELVVLVVLISVSLNDCTDSEARTRALRIPTVKTSDRIEGVLSYGLILRTNLAGEPICLEKKSELYVDDTYLEGLIVKWL
jgi:hypothetical protein